MITSICNFIPKRILFCLMVCLGLLNLYTLRNTLAVAIVTMMDTDVIPREIWNLPSQDVILMSFYPSYIIANFASGSLSARIGGKLTGGLGIAFTAVVTVFIPLASKHHYAYLMLIRVIQGVFEGLAIPSFHTLFGKWFPITERAALTAVCNTGLSLGFLIGHPVTGYLCASSFLGGWPAVFYCFGFVAIVWCVLWCFLIHESPSEHPGISPKELAYILDNQGQEQAQKRPKIPWTSILKSSAVWALCVSSVFSGFFVEFIRLVYPTYLKEMYDYDITQIGWLSMLPHVLDIVVCLSSGTLADYIVKQNPKERRTKIRKVFQATSHIPTIFLLLCVIYIKEDPRVVVALITASFGILAINDGGSRVGPIEISPVFSGTVYGIVNGFSNFCAVSSPLIIGAITAGKQSSRDTWNTVFYISAGCLGIGNLVYLIFGSADLQPWGLYGSKNPSENMPINKYAELSYSKLTDEEGVTNSLDWAELPLGFDNSSDSEQDLYIKSKHKNGQMKNCTK